MSVTNGNNTGPGSLREAITAAVPDSTITISTSFPENITLTESITIDKAVTIISTNNKIITFTGTAFTDRYVFRLLAGSNVTFTGLIFQGVATVNSIAAITCTGTELTPTALAMNSCIVRNWITSASTAPLQLVSVVNANFSFVNSSCVSNTNSKSGQTSNIYVAGTLTTVKYTWEFIDSEFSNNTMGASGTSGISMGHGSSSSVYGNLLISGCSFRNNVNSSHGILAGYGQNTGTVLITNCLAEGGRFTLGYNLHNAVNPEGTSTIIDRFVCRNVTGANFNRIFDISHMSDPREIIIRNTTIDSCTGIPMSFVNVNSGANKQVALEGCTISNNIVPSVLPSGAVSIESNRFAMRMNNCTITNNSGAVGGLSLNNTVLTAATSLTIRSNTIVNNIGSTAGGIRLMDRVFCALRNNIIANNYTDSTRTTQSNIVGQPNIGSWNNLISAATGLTNISNGVQGNQIGTPAAPIDPRLGMLGDYGGDSGLQVIPLLEDSPAINAGRNADAVNTYDARGQPYVRIWSPFEPPVIDIGSFEFQPFIIPCYLGSSLIYVKDIQSGATEYKPATDVYSTKHLVYDMVSEGFIPIVYNAVIEGASVIYKVPVDLLGEDQPFEDFFITSGHPICIDGKEVKARNIPGAIRTKIKRTRVYTIVAQYKTPIKINGLGVYAWSEQEWLDRVRNVGIVWIDNGYF